MFKLVFSFRFYTAIVIVFFNLSGCDFEQKVEKSAQETIIAQIGDKSISLNEFIRRAEYTIRPAYCRGENYIHKKIVLNSLIAEKLFAFEVADDSLLQNQEEFNDYLIGRQEQAMRQMYYFKEAHEKTTVDSSALKKAFAVAGRDYEISYLAFNNKKSAEEAAKTLVSPNSDLAATAEQLFGSPVVKQRKVSINPQENDNVIEALFSDNLNKGQIIGPVKVAKDNHIFMQIDGWIDHKVITEKTIQQRYADTKERLHTKKAMDAYEKHVGALMKNKKMEFSRPVFMKVAELVKPLYLRSIDEKKETFNARLWEGGAPDLKLDELGAEMDKLVEKPLFQVDGVTWTVGDFEKYMRKHPLVFRKRKLSEKTFASEFRLAIADMVRDYYITKDAYAKGYDKLPEVRRNVGMWKDNLYHLYYLNSLLKSSGKMAEYQANPLNVIEEDLNSIVEKLQKKYSGKIQIDTDSFESVNLSRIDLMAYQKNVPFPILVPHFPQITTYNRLDYGSKMGDDE
ncbi:MAG: hypothetical protein DWQ05_12080 [Calditrichaeota bacterium]|nr:MAG: hypothetical protein DWQ05_12080 [Calditrichota bacterium]